MKKLLAILLAVTLLVTVSAFSISARTAYNTWCAGGPGNGAQYGGTIADDGLGSHYGNSYTFKYYGGATAEMYHFPTDHQYWVEEKNANYADCYTDSFSDWATSHIAQNSFRCSHTSW